MKNCRDCGAPLPTQVGPGRPRTYCTDCRPPDTRRRYQPKQKDCVGCGNSFVALNRLGPQRNKCYTCQPRQDRSKIDRPKGTCCLCGQPMWRGKGSLPQGQAKCKPCRKLGGGADYRTPCVDCGAPSWGTRCRPCADKARIIRPDNDPGVTRRHREQAAPGLTRTERTRLLATWKKQGRSCTYCHRPATTIDHVVPLIRGGTNHEGNLTPCCKTCNSSKAGWMLTEWRTGKRCGPGPSAPWAVIVAPPKPAKPRQFKSSKIYFPTCWCGTQFTAKAWTTKNCPDHRDMTTIMRIRYRQQVGIPLDAPLHSRAG